MSGPLLPYITISSESTSKEDVLKQVHEVFTGALINNGFGVLLNKNVFERTGTFFVFDRYCELYYSTFQLSEKQILASSFDYCLHEILESKLNNALEDIFDQWLDQEWESFTFLSN